MTAINITSIVDALKKDEGFRCDMYQCSAGANTIGYGWNVDARPISEHIAALILLEQVMETLAECERLSWFHSLSTVRKGVIINMVFNIGMSRLMGFKRMIAAIETGMFQKAALEMLDSKWSRQVGRRAERLADEMRSG